MLSEIVSLLTAHYLKLGVSLADIVQRGQVYGNIEDDKGRSLPITSMRTRVYPSVSHLHFTPKRNKARCTTLIAKATQISQRARKYYNNLNNNYLAIVDKSYFFKRQ